MLLLGDDLEYMICIATEFWVNVKSRPL
jgi:hypothetical protein